jgi:hypothetical protein
MRKICSQGITFLLLVLLLSLGACQEFIHNSFDTITGQVVDKEGKAVPGLELTLSQNIDFLNGQVPVAKSIVYRIKTDEKGEFSFVLPSRMDSSFEKEYYLLLTAPARFQTEFNGVLLTENFLLATDAPRDADGIRDLGILKIVRE